MRCLRLRFPIFLAKNLLLLSEGRRCNNADETSRQASLFYMFSSKFMLKIGEQSGGVKLSPNYFQHLANQCFVRARGIWVGRSTGESSPQQTNIEFLNLQWRDKILWVQLSPNFCCTLLTWGFTGGWVPWACWIEKNTHTNTENSWMGEGELSCYLILLQYLSISMCHLNLL